MYIGMEICYGHSFGIYFLVSNKFIFVLNKHVKQFSIMRNMTQQEYQTTSTVITISDGRVLPSKYSVLRIDWRNRHQNIFAIGTLLISIWTKPSSNRLLSLILLNIRLILKSCWLDEVVLFWALSLICENAEWIQFRLN